MSLSVFRLSLSITQMLTRSQKVLSKTISSSTKPKKTLTQAQLSMFLQKKPEITMFTTTLTEEIQRMSP